RNLPDRRRRARGAAGPPHRSARETLTAQPPPSRRRCAPFGATLRRLHRDPFGLSLCLRGLRQADGQHALPEARFDPVDVDVLGQAEAALEGAEAALPQEVALPLLLLFVLLLTPDRQVAARHRNIDVFLVESRQLGRHLVGLVLLDDVDGRTLLPAQLAPPEWLGADRGSTERRRPLACIELLEQTVDLATQGLEGTPRRAFGGHPALGSGLGGRSGVCSGSPSG